MSDLIKDKYQFKKGWSGGLPETICGFGSKVNATIKQREWIPKIIQKYNIETIGDIGAGDLNWIKFTDIPVDVKYTPYDLIPRKAVIKQLDIIKEVPEKHDLLMCLWVLNHFSDADAKSAICNLITSGSKYLLITQRPDYYDPDLNVIDRMIINGKGDLMLLVTL